MNRMEEAGKTCPRCGGIAKVGLDHESPSARAIDDAMKSVVAVRDSVTFAAKPNILDKWATIFPRVEPPRARVLTVTKVPPATDWTPEALLVRKSNVRGVVVGYHDAHGLVFEVQHDDGVVACYEPDELHVIDENGLPLTTVLSSMLAPLEPPKNVADLPSPIVPFQIGDDVAVAKIGWAGSSRVAEIRGEHVRVDGTMTMFGQERALWFHYKELTKRVP